MIPAAAIAALAKLGLTAEQVDVVASLLGEVEAATAAAYEAKEEARRAKDRERKRNAPRNSTEIHGADRNSAPSADVDSVKERPPNPQKKEPPLEGTPPTGATPLCPPQRSHRNAHRLPDGWEPSFDPVTFAVSDADRRDKHPLTEIEVVDQIERMRNWARQVGDSKGRKKDWDAALRNWLKEATDRKNDKAQHPANRETAWQRQRRAFDEVFDEFERPDQRSIAGPVPQLPGTGTDGQ